MIGYERNRAPADDTAGDALASCARDIRADLLDGLSPTCAGKAQPSMDDFFVVAIEDARITALLTAIIANPADLMDNAVELRKRLDGMLDKYAEGYAGARMEWLS